MTSVSSLCTGGNWCDIRKCLWATAMLHFHDISSFSNNNLRCEPTWCIMFIVSKWLMLPFNSLFKNPFFLKGLGGDVGITFPVSEALYNFLMAFIWKIDWLIIISKCHTGKKIVCIMMKMETVSKLLLNHSSLSKHNLSKTVWF